MVNATRTYIEGLGMYLQRGRGAEAKPPEAESI